MPFRGLEDISGNGPYHPHFLLDSLIKRTEILAESLGVDIEKTNFGFGLPGLDQPCHAQGGSATNFRAPQMIQFGVPAAHTLDKRNLLGGLTVRWPGNLPFPAHHVFQLHARHNIFEDTVPVRFIPGIKGRKPCGQNDRIRFAGYLIGTGIQHNGFLRTNFLASATGLILQV